MPPARGLAKSPLWRICICRIYAVPLTMNVIERAAPLIPHLVQHASKRLTLKQVAAGNFLVGGGWPSRLARAGAAMSIQTRAEPVMENVVRKSRAGDATGARPRSTASAAVVDRHHRRHCGPDAAAGRSARGAGLLCRRRRRGVHAWADLRAIDQRADPRWPPVQPRSTCTVRRASVTSTTSWPRSDMSLRITTNVTSPQPVTIHVNGRDVSAYEGESLATALIAADVLIFSRDERRSSLATRSPTATWAFASTAWSRFGRISGNPPLRVRACLTRGSCRPAHHGSAE